MNTGREAWGTIREYSGYEELQPKEKNKKEEGKVIT
jgi:hypothetical protein